MKFETNHPFQFLILIPFTGGILFHWIFWKCVYHCCSIQCLYNIMYVCAYPMAGDGGLCRWIEGYEVSTKCLAHEQRRTRRPNGPDSRCMCVHTHCVVYIVCIIHVHIPFILLSTPHTVWFSWGGCFVRFAAGWTAATHSGCYDVDWKWASHTSFMYQEPILYIPTLDNRISIVNLSSIILGQTVVLCIPTVLLKVTETNTFLLH